MSQAPEAPHEYLRTASFSPNAIQSTYPNAKRILTEGLFVSHSGQDSKRIYADIVLPVLFDRFADGIFFHSRGSGGANAYKQLVQAALHFCDKFLIVISRSSLNNLWVRAEVDWAFDHQRPVVGCTLDDSNPSALHPRLVPGTDSDTLPMIDFRSDVEVAQRRLAHIVDDLLQRFPYRRLSTHARDA